jgi:hypothetical protein
MAASWDIADPIPGWGGNVPAGQSIDAPDHGDVDVPEDGLLGALFRAVPADDDDDGRAPDVDPADALPAVERMLRGNRLGLAAWLARCVAPDLGEALAVLAWRASCAATTALWPTSCGGARSVCRASASASHDPDVGLVLAAACCLAAPLAPYSGCAELLDDLPPKVAGVAEVRRVTAAVVRAAHGGLRWRPTESGHPPDRAELTAALAEIRAEAALLLSRARSRSIKFFRRQQGLLGVDDPRWPVRRAADRGSGRRPIGAGPGACRARAAVRRAQVVQGAGRHRQPSALARRELAHPRPRAPLGLGLRPGGS